MAGDLEAARLPRGAYAAFLELHIEQGPLLEAAGVPIGVVTAIAAPATLRVELSGEGGHAGAVLMPDRHDPLVAAAEVVRAVDREARGSGSDDTVGTVGLMTVEPGAVNSIPRRVRMDIDLRDVDAARRDAVLGRVRAAAREAAASRGVGHADEILNADGPATSDPALIAAIEEAAPRRGWPRPGWSAARYHDCVFMARVCPAAMIFVPSAGGVSHRPDEYTSRAADRAGRAGARRGAAPAGRLRVLHTVWTAQWELHAGVTSVAGTPAKTETTMTHDAELDLLGIGNAIVDVLAHCDDAFLEAEGLVKGSMNLIEVEESNGLYEPHGAGVEVSGGAAANSMAGAASFGSRVAYVGKIRDDQLGAVFQHDIRAAGVHFATPIAPDGPPTARSLILVTPDAHRTMSTYLGAAVELGPEDIDTDLVARCAVTYLEGYLWDKPRAKDAFRVAMAAARGAGRRVSLTLSDSFCVERHREEFRALVETEVDILFANEEEILALTQTRDLGTAVAAVRGRSEIVVVTRSEHGSMVVTADDTVEVPAAPLERLVDTTGAGDLYAAGFLHGITHGRPLAECAALGSLAASEVISHLGARPQADLAALAAAAV